MLPWVTVGVTGVSNEDGKPSFIFGVGVFLVDEPSGCFTGSGVLGGSSIG